MSNYFALDLSNPQVQFFKPGTQNNYDGTTSYYRLAHAFIRHSTTREVRFHESMRPGYDMLMRLVRQDPSLTLCVVIDTGSDDFCRVYTDTIETYHLCYTMFVAKVVLDGSAYRLVTIDPRSYVFSAMGYRKASNANMKHNAGCLNEVKLPLNTKSNVRTIELCNYVREEYDDDMPASHFEYIGYDPTYPIYSYFFGSFSTLSFLGQETLLKRPDNMYCVFYKGEEDVTETVIEYYEQTGLWFSEDPTFDFFWEMI